MLGIVWDVTKLIDRIFERHVEECHYLRGLVTSRDVRIEELEKILSSTPNAVASIESARGDTPHRIRNWRDQKAILEKKFQPSELQEREKRWKDNAAALSREVEQDAG